MTIAALPLLRELSGLERRTAVKRWLKANGVPFMVQPSGDPVTTMDAINRALYGGRKATEPDLTTPTCNYRQKSIKRTGVTTTSTKTNGNRSHA